MLRSWWKQFCLVLATVLLLGMFYYNREPERCGLCDWLPCHAPCLLNLSTGELGEMEVYDRHLEKVGEIAEQQQGGTLSFFPCAGLNATRDTVDWSTVVHIPENSGRMKNFHFCESCRRLLKQYRQDGYVLVDLYHVDRPVIYPIRDKAVYEIRCYNIDIQKDTAFRITVTGLWNPPDDSLS